MLDFIVENYYVILIICILLIFGIIGYIVDTLKNSNLKNENNLDTYIPEEEVFIQESEEENASKEESEEEETAEDLIEEYNNQNKEDSK